jgi:hypothetical protein
MDTSHLIWRTASYSNNGANCVEVAAWRKASYSNNGASCVEVGTSRDPGDAAFCLVRDTKDRTGPSLAFAAAQWAAFTARIKSGEFARPA